MASAPGALPSLDFPPAALSAPPSPVSSSSESTSPAASTSSAIVEASERDDEDELVEEAEEDDGDGAEGVPGALPASRNTSLRRRHHPQSRHDRHGELQQRQQQREQSGSRQRRQRTRSKNLSRLLEGRLVHRHLQLADDALSLLWNLDVSRIIQLPGANGFQNAMSRQLANGKGKARETHRDIVHALEDNDWDYKGVVDGVHIFSFQEDHAQHSKSGSHASEERPNGHNLRHHGFPIREGAITPNYHHHHSRHDALPVFRGEGFLEGSWRMDDIVATARSPGARGVWDPRFDARRSAIVENLSAQDVLSHLWIRGSFPVGDRDASIISSYARDPETGRGYLASTSVDDRLIPRSGPRTHIVLNGYILRPVDACPVFLRADDSDSSEESEGEGEVSRGVRASKSPPASRPSLGHRRAKSSISTPAPQPPLPGGAPATLTSPPLVGAPLPTSASKPVFSHRYAPPEDAAAQPHPPLTRPPLLVRRSQSQVRSLSDIFAAGSPSHADNGSQRDAENSRESPVSVIHGETAEPLSNLQPATMPGYHVSIVVKASPGGSLPRSYVNQLSLSLPLSIGRLARYIKNHGFAPHLVQPPATADAKALSVLEERFEPDTCTFRVVFRLVPNTPFARAGTTRVRFCGLTFARGFAIDVSGESTRWRLEYDVSPTAEDLSRQDELSADGLPARTTIIPNDIDIADPAIDLAQLPGARGGCTLCIDNATVKGSISVSVKRTSDSAFKQGLLAKLGESLERAANLEFSASSIDALFEHDPTAIARQRLMAARETLSVLHREPEPV